MLTPAGYQLLSTLSPRAIQLLCIVMSLCDLSKYRAIDPQDLARRCPMSADCIYDLMGRLVECGLLEQGRTVLSVDRKRHVRTYKIRREFVLQWI
jgi:hypothetical protein